MLPGASSPAHACRHIRAAMHVVSGLPTTAGQHPHDPGLITGASERTHLSAPRLRGLLAACESLGAPREAGEQPYPEGDPHAQDAAPLDALAACERCSARGEHAALLQLLEADALRELAGGRGSGPGDPSPVSHPGRRRARLGAGYREALEHDAALPAGVRVRVAALNALRGVLLGKRPRAALLLGAGLHDLGLGYGAAEPARHGQGLGSLGPGPPHVKAEAAGHADDNLGVAEYLLRVLRRLGMPGAQAGAGEAPAPALQEQARELAAWLEAAAGLGAGASPSPEQPMDGGLPDDKALATRPAPGGERSRLGAFLAHLRKADAGLHSDCDPLGHVQRGQQAEATAAGSGAGVPAGGLSVKTEPSSGAAETCASGEDACKAEPDIDMDSQRDAADASGTAAAAGWAAAALRARAVHLACLAPNHDPGREPGRDSVLDLFACAPDAGGWGSSDLAFGAWLCRGGGSDATSADGRAGSRKRKREAGAGEGAPVPAAPSAAAAEEFIATGQAVDDQDAGGRSLPCDLADAVARHGLPSPALLAQALAQLLDGRDWGRIGSLERAAAARADPSPDPDPDPGPGLQDDAACSAAEGASAAASAAGAEGGDGAAGPAGRGAASDAACRQLLRCSAALAAFLSGLLDPPSSAAEVRLIFVSCSCYLPLSVGTSCLPLNTDLRWQDMSSDTHLCPAGTCKLIVCLVEKTTFFFRSRLRRRRSRRRRASGPCRRCSAAWAPRSRRRRRRRPSPSPDPLSGKQRLPRSKVLY